MLFSIPILVSVCHDPVPLLSFSGNFSLSKKMLDFCRQLGPLMRHLGYNPTKEELQVKKEHIIFANKVNFANLCQI
jgi:hypothetical protein